VSLLLYALGQWDQAAHYNLEPPLVALVLGLLVSNTVGVPGWAEPALRVELYVKTGIVLLGAGLPLTLIAWAGPVAIGQAAIVSLVTFGVIYFVGVRLGLDRRLAATLGTGGAVCGVSGAIATAGAVGARKEQVSIAISLVILWAIVTIFLLPLAARAFGLSTGVAGAWIGTSEFADAAGLAAAQTYGGYAGHVPGILGRPEAAVDAFTLMKVIGRDVWIGVWAFVLSLVATTRWESTGVKGRARVGEIWSRFPKFVLGFLLASAIVTLLSGGYGYVEYKKVLVPTLVAPLQALRTWAFIFTFLGIGLTTRFRELATVGAKPFYAFTAGVVVISPWGSYSRPRYSVISGRASANEPAAQPGQITAGPCSFGTCLRILSALPRGSGRARGRTTRPAVVEFGLRSRAGGRWPVRTARPLPVGCIFVREIPARGLSLRPWPPGASARQT
jgi:uncharacterized membrane protein YadS